MGLDGGTKITRSDVLRRQSSRWAQQDTSRSTRGGSVSQVYQEQQLDEQIRRAVLWTTCALSGLPLVAPIVADALGQLVNKQAVLEHILATKAAAAAAAGASTAAALPAASAALPAPSPAAAVTAGSVPQQQNCGGSLVAHSAPAAAAAAAARAPPPKELAAACLRYENQQRAAAAAAAAGGEGGAASAAGSFDHIKSLKDVFAVQLTPNPDAQRQPQPQAAAAAADQPALVQLNGHQAQHNSSSSSSSGIGEELPSPWMCPVTLQPCGSKQPFAALRPCGHVLSLRAIAAITPAAQPKARKSSSRAPHAPAQPHLADSNSGDEEGAASDCPVCCCPVCEVPFDPARDQIPINGSQQHMSGVRVQLQEAAAAKAAAKQRKRKRAADAADQQQQQQRVLALPSCESC